MWFWQIIAAEGMNATGEKLVVEKINEVKFFQHVILLTVASQYFNRFPCGILQGTLEPCPSSRPSETLSLVVTTGPFTTSDNFMYEPLTDLVLSLIKNPPDVCFLVRISFQYFTLAISMLCNLMNCNLFLDGTFYR